LLHSWCHVERLISPSKLDLAACPYTLALGKALPITFEVDTIWPINDSAVGVVKEDGKIFVEGKITGVEDIDECFRFFVVSSVVLF
jgi:hypothetical protein